jgi:hypothetical protein
VGIYKSRSNDKYDNNCSKAIVEPTDCSGKCEKTTGIYTDIIKTGSDVLWTSWSLTDSTNLILKLKNHETLSALK